MVQGNITYRKATEKDIPLLIDLIREMADYEKLLDEVSIESDVLADQLFIKKRAEAIILELNDSPIGYLIYFYNFSTFMGRSGLYVEDIYLKHDYRGRGFGTEVFDYLEQLAREEGCGRMEWACLDWNENARKFYQRFGASPMDDWSIFRKTL